MRRRAAAATLLMAAACARMEPPPGGPPDNAAPVLLGTVPESTRVVEGFDGEVEFRFNETVSEGASASLGLGTGDLERLIILSPDSQVPTVSWKRTRITVRPRGGWEPGRTYRVELLPGLMDLRRNRSLEGAVVTFATGGPVPERTLPGRVGDWTTGRPAPGALVEAILLPDSLSYRSVADSTGRFAIGPLPDGVYLLRATIDGNRNVRHDSREAWDTLPVPPGATDSTFLWTFAHDTLGPRLQSVRVRDSLTLSLTFSQVLLPGQSLDAAGVRLLMLPDSIPVPTTTLLFTPAHDSLYRAVVDTAARRDSAAADSVRAPPEDQRPARPADRADARVAAATADTTFRRVPLPTELALRLGAPLLPGTSYFLEVRGIRNANGAMNTSGLGFTTPEPPAPAAAPDSLGPTPADSSAAPDP